MIPVQVIGLGMSSEDLPSRSRAIIKAAQVLVGGKRLLGYFPEHPAPKITLAKDLTETLLQIKELARTQRVVVLASGDPNFYGIGPRLARALGPDQVVIHSNITAVQAACSRLKIAWQDAALISLHGRDWEALDRALGTATKLIIYTDPDHTPARIARRLINRGWESARVCVLEDLGQGTEQITWLSPQEAQTRQFSRLNLVVVLADPSLPPNQGLTLGMPEAAYSHQAGLVTKSEVRAVVLARLELGPGQVLWDLGAGCGSVGIEASLLIPQGRIIAVEKDRQRAAQIQANRDKFGVRNLEVIGAEAPQCLAQLPAPDRVFIGGGGGQVQPILVEVFKHLKQEGKLVLTAVLFETLQTAFEVMHRQGYEVDCCQLQISRSRRLGSGTSMQALNPVWIIAGRPGG